MRIKMKIRMRMRVRISVNIKVNVNISIERGGFTRKTTSDKFFIGSRRSEQPLA